MKTRILLLCLLCVNFFSAQGKDLDKIAKYFSAGKYDKAIKLCDKELSSPSNSKNPDFYYYKSLSMFKQADSSSGSYFKEVSASITIAGKGAAYDKKLQRFNKQDPEFKTFLETAHKQAEIKYYSNKLKEAKTLEGAIARCFKDTSELYHTLYDIVPKKKEEVVEKPVVIVLKSNAKKIDSLVYFASTHIGKEYKYGKEGPEAFDCSGFIGFCFKTYGEKLPHNAHLISKLGEEVKMEDIRKGDLIFFGSSSAYHVAMYIAEKGKTPQIIHCVSRGVCVDDFNATTHWGKSSVYKIKRLIK
jgi:cell wall-associated NlpC family hydrolase